ncbi:hypothetical protein CK203_045364 [Vitis vinifera]|uniref:Uncharacterized protein n=1 Tax=Vitis vinifera TaxID=29760 RepID=A0A438H968_VITVI|nr:hypothetical protein CK203_045364 [Vitis vinifera]
MQNGWTNSGASFKSRRNRRIPLHKQGRFIRSALALPPQLVEIHNRGIRTWEVKVTTELPTNWYEDPHFLGFVVSCVYRHIPTSDFDYRDVDLMCELNLHGNGFEFKGKCYRYDSPGNFKDLIDQVCVWWYPKIAIRKEHHHKYTHINASFRGHWTEIKNAASILYLRGDQQNHMPMLEHPQNSGDNGSALQDTDGNVHGANQDDEHYHIPMLLDLPGNFGDIGSVILEGTDGNRKRRRGLLSPRVSGIRTGCPDAPSDDVVSHGVSRSIITLRTAVRNHGDGMWTIAGYRDSV